MKQSNGGQPTIAIVGPCAAGKSSLAARLLEAGYKAHQIAQEHSYVQDMWQVFSSPDILIYLGSSFEASERRKHLNWNEEDFNEQIRRLAHAREHCDIFIDTTNLTEDDVARKALEELRTLISTSYKMGF